MGVIKLWIIISVSSVIFTVTCVTIIQLILFLSQLPDVARNLQNPEEGGKSVISKVVLSVVTDISLICVFILQHSFLIQPLKHVANKLYVPVLERSFYNLTTCVALLTLIRCWKVNTAYVLWNVDVLNNQALTAAYYLIHTVTWLIIYVGIICMDVTELFGIKQVYYFIKNESNPAKFKSRGLQRFHKHMRHPSLVGFLILLWVFPIMSLDRLLLAAIWSVYMIIAWKPDIRDYHYILKQQHIKRIL